MVMHVELQATCSALGYQEGDKYVKEPDCLETVKDLIRFLKREDDTCDIRRQLGHAQILQKDLIPILKHYQDEATLFETVLRLTVNLTQPTVLCFGNKLPTDKTMRNHALEIDSHLQAYKEAFIDEELFAVLAAKVGDILKLDWESRHEEDRLLLERLLILIRNILHVPPNPDLEQRTDDDASLHDQVLWVIHVSGLEDMILYIASSENERQLCMHLLEIVSLMFREQTPDTLACAGMQRSMSEKEKDERELEMIREKERAQKKANMLKHSTRHSRFGGTYVVANMKSISDRELIYHKAQADVKNFSLDSNKRPKKKPKNRQPIKDVEVKRRSTLSIRLSLKEFCIQFLENAYNPLMYAVKDNLVRERTQEHDETYYLWAMRFFMEFCRHHSKRIELVSETLSVPTFHYIYTNLITYYEMIMTEKTEAVTWSKRVHLALKAYQELLLTVDMMDRSKNPRLIESAKVIRCNVFYMMEFRDIFTTLLKKFDQSKQSRTYLRDLVETSHLFVKMLEYHCKNNSHLVVQKKKTKKKKPKVKANVAPEPLEPTPQELEDLWDEISSQLSSIFQGRDEVPDVAPFDAASEVEVDQQRVDAMCRIQDSMRNRSPGEAIAIFRAAREVWPERDEFGTQNMPPEDEFMALREIFMAPLPKPNRPSTQTQPEEWEEPQQEEEEEVETSTSEQEFDFMGFILTFSKPEILKAYGILLSDFEKNSDHTNHCIVKMLHRVAFDLGYTAMVFQASIFRVFQKVLLGPYARLSRFREMIKFGTHIVRRFVETAEQNKKVFMELLFWKGSKEAMEICHGYGTVSSSKGKVQWSEELEQELLRLYDEFRDAEHPEKDTVDLIMERLTDPSKTRGQVIRELKKQGLIGSAKELKKKPSGISRSGPWREEEELQLTDLYHQFKDSSDPLGNILSNLTNKRSKAKVIEKLINLSLVNDRKELYKKRKRKSGKAGSDSEDDVRRGSDSDDGSVNNDDGGHERFVSSASESSSEEETDQGSTAGGGEETRSVEQRLKSVVQNGYRDQIVWIQRGLRRTAEDRERDDYRVAVPIVPLTEDNETAMEDKMFLDFLQLIGISPPANEQEAFWRIPAHLSVSDLNNIIDGLELDENGEPIAAEKIKPVQKEKAAKKQRKTKSVSASQKKDRKAAEHQKKEEKMQKQKEEKKKTRDRMKALKALAKQRKDGNKRKRKDTNNTSDSEESEKENIGEEPEDANILNGNVLLASGARETTLIKKKPRIKKVVQSDSDSDDNRLIIAGSENNDSEAEKDSSRPPAKRPKLFDSDSDNDSQPVSQQSETRASPEKQNKLFNSDSSEDEDMDTVAHSSNVVRGDRVQTDESSNDIPSASIATQISSHLANQSLNSSRITVDDEASVTSLADVKEKQTVKSDDSDSDAASVTSSIVPLQTGKKIQENKFDDDSEASSVTTQKKGRKQITKKSRKIKSDDDESGDDSEASSVTTQKKERKQMTKKSRKIKSDDERSDVDSEASSVTMEKKGRKKMMKKSRKIKSDDEISDVDSEASSVTTQKKGRKQMTKKSRKLKSDDDESGDDSEASSVTMEKKGRKQMTKKSRKLKSDDESGDDSEASSVTMEKKGRKQMTKKSRKLKSDDDRSDVDSEASSVTMEKKGRKQMTKKSRKLKSDDDESGDDSEATSVTPQKKGKKQMTKKSKKLKSDDDNEKSDSESEALVTLQKKKKNLTSKKGKKFISDDDDTESVKSGSVQKKSLKKPGSKQRNETTGSDSEDEVLSAVKKTSAQRKRVDSDSVSNASSVSRSAKKKPAKKPAKKNETDESSQKAKPTPKTTKGKKGTTKSTTKSKQKKKAVDESEDEPLEKFSKSKSTKSDDSSSEDEPILALVKAKTSQVKRQRPQDSSSDDEVLASVKNPEKRQRVTESDTEMMSPLQLAVTPTQDSTQEVTQEVKQDPRKLFNSDDDSSDDEPLINSRRDTGSKATDTFPATLLTQPAGESDSDVDDHVPLRRVLKKKKVIDSDDD
ncbi:protein timeless homolog isoform X2 [Haliotis rufescens]|uniref:protein timeless homolog isoform X2 n=1 Tax=Haliotis rufescens TaxID=6454 RepID=UPI00201E9C2C|nr:protein timeless homolog isoform X2 [Haliotis rufescens]